MVFLFVYLRSMFKKFLKLLIYFVFINNINAAKEGTGYNKGVKNKQLSKITKLLDSKDYKKAIILLKKEINEDKSNADLYNLLGYAYRNENNFDLSIKSYEIALTIDPNHLGVHNYMGITYLKLGKINKSRLHLQKLYELCNGKCDEYKSLKKELSKTLKNEN